MLGNNGGISAFQLQCWCVRSVVCGCRFFSLGCEQGTLFYEWGCAQCGYMCDESAGAPALVYFLVSLPQMKHLEAEHDALLVGLSCEQLALFTDCFGTRKGFGCYVMCVALANDIVSLFYEDASGDEPHEELDWMTD